MVCTVRLGICRGYPTETILKSAVNLIYSNTDKTKSAAEPEYIKPKI